MQRKQLGLLLEQLQARTLGHKVVHMAVVRMVVVGSLLAGSMAVVRTLPVDTWAVEGMAVGMIWGSSNLTPGSVGAGAASV